MVTLTLLGTLAALGGPSLFAFLNNSKIRTAAQAFYSSAQAARAEAVRRNANVQLIMLLPTVAPVAANKDTDNVPDNQQGTRGWMVRATTIDPAVFDFVEGKAITEGGGEQVIVGYTGGILTFNPMSGVANSTGVAVSYNFSNPTGGNCTEAGGPMRCLRVVVSPGGRIQLCDPVIDTVGDTRRCPN